MAVGGRCVGAVALARVDLALTRALLARLLLGACAAAGQGRGSGGDGGDGVRWTGGRGGGGSWTRSDSMVANCTERTMPHNQAGHRGSEERVKQPEKMVGLPVRLPL